MDTVAPETVGLSSTRLARIGPLMERYIASGRPPGVITLVARHGKVVHFACHGLRDVAANLPMEPDTILRMYSMTKPVTSVALMMLFEEGCFTLDEPIAKYIPELGKMRVWVGQTATGPQLADVHRPITIQDLLTHTSGLAYGLWPGTPVEDIYAASAIHTLDRGLQVPLDEFVRRLGELPLAHQPGTAFRYSLAHDVVGHLIGVLSDVPFDVFLQERLFQPLGMVDTGFCVPREKLARFAALYSGLEPGDVRLEDAPTESSRFARESVTPSGGGGLLSTAADWLRFAQMLLNGGQLDGVRILGRKTVERMTTNHLPAHMIPIAIADFPWPGMGYGLGFGVCVDGAQRPSIHPTGVYGWPGGANTWFWVDPKEELIGMVLPQVLFLGVPLAGAFQNVVYSAIED